jgi:hypothetical protein
MAGDPPKTPTFLPPMLAVERGMLEAATLS